MHMASETNVRSMSSTAPLHEEQMQNLSFLHGVGEGNIM